MKASESKINERVNMETSGIALHRLLVRLDRPLLALLEDHPEDRDSMAAFVDESGIITEHVAPEGKSWLHGRVGFILDGCGKMREGYLSASNCQSSNGRGAF